MDIVVRPSSPGEEIEACNLAVRSFNEFIAPGFPEEGIGKFYEYANYRALRERLESDYFVMVAEIEGKLAGMIEIKKHRHVSMLYVDKKYQRRGVATRLLEEAIGLIRKNSPEIRKITVNSSRHATVFYEEMGFRQRSSERIINGIPHTPMSLLLRELK